MEPSEVNSTDLDNFLEFLFEGLSGYAYLAAKDPNLEPTDPGFWKQEFFPYPDESKKLKSAIRAASQQYEIYLAPVLYSEKKCDKETFKATNVVYTEFDGNAPEWEDVHGDPSLIIQSSDDSNQHCYWRLNEPITDVSVLETVNRNIQYNMQADSSAWDATQVLRPPDTYNHKRGTPVLLKVNNSVSYDLAVFDDLTPAPEPINTTEWKISALPNVEDVILKHAFTPDLVRLLKKGKDDVSDGSGQRARSLVNLAYGACQMGLQDAEVFVLLLFCDNKWEKFKGRRDQHKRLAHIITVARNKYPEPDTSTEYAMVWDFKSLLNSEITIDWVVENMLMEQGMMLWTGPGGVSKTTLAMRFMIALALGQDYLGYSIPEPKKIGFMSLEMGHGEVQKTVEHMAGGLSKDQIELLRENFQIIPHGEPWPLNLPEGQEQAENFVTTYGIEGLFIDSVGSALIGNISSG